MGIERLLPQCPIFKLMIEYNLRNERLDIYSRSYKICPECRGNDNKCEIYGDWLRSQGMVRK